MPEKHLISEDDDELSSPCPSPRKRRRRHSNASEFKTPTRSTFSSPAFASTSKYYQSQPSDSPTNPFGRRRTLALLASLPEPTGFGSHLVLRFQFVRPTDPRSAEGVYRILQVPIGYTFAHLRALVSFLFGGAMERMVCPEQRGWEDEERGHLWEVKKRIELYDVKYRRGVIKKGQAWVRMATARDPYRYKANWELDDEEEEKEEKEEEEWRWETEDEFAVENVWPDPHRVNLDLGIIYHHAVPTPKSRPTQVHITIHKGTPPEQRKGKGNSPYVFSARGEVFISPLMDKAKVKSKKESLSKTISSSVFNEPPGAFETYYRRNAVMPQPDFDDDDEEEDELSLLSTPGLTSGSSQSQTRSQTLLPSSSPYRFSSPVKFTSMSSPINFASTSSPIKFSSRFASSPLKMPSSFPKVTPLPRPGQRKRLEYMRRRMERSSRKEEERERERLMKKKARDQRKAREREKREVAIELEREMARESDREEGGNDSVTSVEV